MRFDALTRYRIMAWVTGVVLATMTALLVYGAVSHDSAFRSEGNSAIAIGWSIHGYGYLVYVLTVGDLAYRRRWPLLKVVLVALAGTIPLASFFAEHRVVGDDRRDHPRGDAERPARRVSARR